MIVPPNSPRPGVIGGFAIEPQALLLPASWTANSTWIGLGGAPYGFSPTVGDEIEFLPSDIYSGMAFVVGSVFNWRGPYTTSTAYAVGDCFAWFDTDYVVKAWYVVTAFTSGAALSDFHPASPVIRKFTFRGPWIGGTAYTVADVVIAADSYGVVQTWVANSSFTAAGGAFSAGSQWVGALAAQQIFYVVGISAGTIQISTTPTGSPITFMTGGFFIAPNVQPQIKAYLGVASFGSGAGLVPMLSLGALFAQGVLYQPTGAPTVPAAPANQFSYLCYNSTTHFYWTTNPAGTTAGDAVVGWVETNATDIIRASNQNIIEPAVAGAFSGTGTPSGGIVPPIDLTAPTPACGIATAGGGTVTWTPITFAAGVDVTQITAATIVLLYQGATQAATAHVATALGGTAASGSAATLVLNADMTGVVFAGDWLLAGGEMMYVTADAASASVAVDRALALTTAEAHAIGQAVYRLSTAVFTYSFPALFFLSTQSASWGPTESLSNALIALFNVVVFASDVESAQSPVNYSQAMGGLIATGTASGSGFLAHNVAPVTTGAAALNFALYRSLAVGPLTDHTTINAVNATGLAPFLWTLSVSQDGTGGRAMIPGTGLTFALATEQSPANTYVTALILWDGAHHILISSTGDLPIP